MRNRAEVCNRRPIHVPDHQITGYIAPQDVRLAVAVKVSNSGHRPVLTNVSNVAAGGNRKSIHEPHGDVSSEGVAPENVLLPIAIEISDSADNPFQSLSRDSAEVHDGGAIH